MKSYKTTSKAIQKMKGADKDKAIKLATDNGISYDKDKDILFTEMELDSDAILNKLSKEELRSEAWNSLLQHKLRGEERNRIESTAGLIERDETASIIRKAKALGKLDEVKKLLKIA